MDEQNPGPARILVVDDERGPRESLRMILTPHHEVRLARSGSQALGILGGEPVDVVTLDLNMPGLGGQELMRSIHHEFPHVEIIVITGCGTLESAAEGIRYGICDYLQKPPR
jgi:DNA-binding NtrC family response regulator